ncbi:MAG: hypothetical protein AAF960_04160 [Bacteroidota bacterium]
MQLPYRFFYLIFSFFLFSHHLSAQTVNFEETWKEFLDNNKISNMSALNKPSKYDDPLNYIKYLLMNTNNSFCQSEMDRAESLMAEINEFSTKAYDRVPKFTEKKKDLEAKIKAYYDIEVIWQEFLETKEVDIDKLESIEAAKRLCEKQTLAKYSYMIAYDNFCKGNVNRAKAIIENRTLRLTEKTSLRVEDVEGLKPELAKMKLLFQNITQLEDKWNEYVETGISPGFTTELPLFPCYPIPNIKEWLLKGAANVCDAGEPMFEKIKELQAKSGVELDNELTQKLRALESALEDNQDRVATLNKTWRKFIKEGEITKADRDYGYEYCRNEPLVRAYIMDGFTNICGITDDRLREIEELERTAKAKFSKETIAKVNDLQAAFLQYQTDEADINLLWEEFKAQSDTLYGDYRLANYYCDHIYDVKAWIMRGLMADCKQSQYYLEQIDEIKKSLEFEFALDIRCRVTKLRIKIWDCQAEALAKLARIQAPDAFDEKMQELIREYGIGERPVPCEE